MKKILMLSCFGLFLIPPSGALALGPVDQLDDYFRTKSAQAWHLYKCENRLDDAKEIVQNIKFEVDSIHDNNIRREAGRLWDWYIELDRINKCSK